MEHVGGGPGLWLTVKVNAAWRILEDDMRVQKVVTWMDNQRLDKQLLVAAVLKDERLSRCKKEQVIGQEEDQE